MRVPYENTTELRPTLAGRAVPQRAAPWPILSPEPPTHSLMKQTIHHIQCCLKAGIRAETTPNTLDSVERQVAIAEFAIEDGAK